MMKKLILAIFLISTIVSCGKKSEQSAVEGTAAASADVKKLMDEYDDANKACKTGEFGDSPCSYQITLGEEINSKGWCLGEADKKWHECDKHKENSTKNIAKNNSPTKSNQSEIILAQLNIDEETAAKCEMYTGAMVGVVLKVVGNGLSKEDASNLFFMYSVTGKAIEWYSNNKKLFDVNAFHNYEEVYLRNLKGIDSKELVAPANECSNTFKELSIALGKENKIEVNAFRNMFK